MNQQGKRALGITLGVILAIGLTIGLVDRVRDDGSEEIQSRTPTDVAMQSPTDAAMQSETPVDATTQGRTPIDVAALGPQVGERVPAFSLPDQNGRVRTLESILGRNGAMLLFHRSADW